MILFFKFEFCLGHLYYFKLNKIRSLNKDHIRVVLF